MKRILKLLVLISLLCIITTSSVYAEQNTYVVMKKIEYKNEHPTTLKQGFIEILLGQLDFTQYAKDEYIKITPKPDEIRKDDFGNMYAYYDATGMLPGERKNITIERKVVVSTFVTDEPILARSNGSVTKDNKMYVEPQERIESNNEDIIKKANEITEGLTTDYRKASAIFEYVNTTLVYDTSETYANKGALSALKNNKGVCEEFATLFVALCRAEDIPSRVVAGYKVEEVNKVETLIDHAWAEIYLDEYGWIPVEPTVIYTINGKRFPYWNTFCALNVANHIPTELYSSEKGNRSYQLVTETSSSFVQSFYANNNIMLPEQNNFYDISSYGWAKDSIQTLFELGIVKGYSDTEYGPARNISRIEFIAMLSRALAYFDENHVDKANIYYYPSYSQSHWSKAEYDYFIKCVKFYSKDKDDISSAGYYFLSNIFGDGANLERAITRGEAVALMDLFLGDSSSWNAFKDVNGSYRFANSISKAYSSGIIEGYPDGTFRPSNTITRAEMACVLGRFITNNSYVIK